MTAFLISFYWKKAKRVIHFDLLEEGRVAPPSFFENLTLDSPG